MEKFVPFYSETPAVHTYSKRWRFWISESPPLNLHSYNDNVPFIGPYHLPKFGGKKPKATTKFSVQEPPINQDPETTT